MLLEGFKGHYSSRACNACGVNKMHQQYRHGWTNNYYMSKKYKGVKMAQVKNIMLSSETDYLQCLHIRYVPFEGVP